ncbi:hypothetical protein CHF19_10 [Pseudomonas phage CHF19]|uniref:HNH nuclease domain-containing protein n=2 Tax=Ghunavirus PSA2 TaxID=2733621 RepID=A0A7D0TNI2_9CAUD|nr:hypothetical protein CHF19_10 [Pseudomonas phage CHF19]QHB48119.1 hypothetical protein CHF17_10 [Pseudomonas phage CHF17]
MTSECLIFTGFKDAFGYGHSCHNGRKGYAHRIAYEKANGPIPKGLFVMHRCDNPSCINPNHLTLGTEADNRNDMYAKGRNAKGTMNKTAKLDGEKVRAIRASNLPLQELQEIYGVSKSILSDVRRGKRWAHVQ